MLSLTPAMHIRNEEYWLYYVLRGLCAVFDSVFILDTGSTDNTLAIIDYTAKKVNHAKVTLIQENYGNNAVAIGNCPNILREIVPTDWMLLVDGDEVWGKQQLRALTEITPPPDTLVGMCNGRNLVNANGKLMEREGFSADRLFYRTVRWNVRRDYPFQSHGLDDKWKRNQVFHSNFEQSYFWHVRHLQRSSQDDRAFFRNTKQGYFPDAGNHRELPEDWLGEVDYSWPNPYLK